jgi:hypothetical protein
MVAHFVKKNPAFYGIRRFIAVFTRDRHWFMEIDKAYFTLESYTFP